MALPFEVRAEAKAPVTPEQAWQAITTGSAVDGWFMGANEIEPGLGGAVRTALPGFTMEARITEWDPPHRFASTSPEGDDGRLMTLAYEIEGHGGSTTIRMVHSGFLPDDDWEQEFEALKIGDPAYLQKLIQYLTYFRGRDSTPVSAWGPKVDRDTAWQTFRRVMGLTAPVREGDPVRFTPAGLPPIDGVVDYVSSDFLGVRTSDALYRFIHGMGTVALGHHLFKQVDQQEAQQKWESWLAGLFA